MTAPNFVFQSLALSLIAAACGGLQGPDRVDCNALQLECSGLNEDQCEQREDCSPYRTWRYGGGDYEACLSQPVEAKEFVLCEAGGDRCGFGFFATQACIWRAADPQRCWCDSSLISIADGNPDWGWAPQCDPMTIFGDAENPCGWEPGGGGAGGNGGTGGIGGEAGAGGDEPGN